MTNIRIASLIIVLAAASGASLMVQRPALGSAVSAPAIDSLASPAGPGSTEPYLAVGPKGEVYLSWLEPGDSGHVLRFSVLTRNRWAPARTIRAGRDFFVNWADFPSIEVLDGNRLAAHWLQRTGTSPHEYGVRITQSADGGKTWSRPVTPHRDSATPGDHGFVSMWAEKGKLGALWLDSRNKQGEGHAGRGDMALISTTLDRKGTLDRENVVDSRTCDCCQTSAAPIPGGQIVAYRDRSADEIRDIYVARQLNGKWTPGVAVHDDGWKINGCPVNGPAVAASGNRVAVAWFTAARDTAKVNVAFSTDGGSRFGAPVRLDGGAPAGRVDATMLSDGSALVTWIERTGGDTAAVRVRRVTAAGAAGPPLTVASSSAARASGFPRLVIAGPNVVFAWTVPGRPSTVRVARAPVSMFK
jgi:hypothetical protein